MLGETRFEYWFGKCLGMSLWIVDLVDLVDRVPLCYREFVPSWVFLGLLVSSVAGCIRNSDRKQKFKQTFFEKINEFIYRVNQMILSYNMRHACQQGNTQNKKHVIEIAMFLQKSKHDDPGSTVYKAFFSLIWVTSRSVF